PAEAGCLRQLCCQRLDLFTTFPRALAVVETLRFGEIVAQVFKPFTVFSSRPSIEYLAGIAHVGRATVATTLAFHQLDRRQLSSRVAQQLGEQSEAFRILQAKGSTLVCDRPV